MFRGAVNPTGQLSLKVIHKPAPTFGWLLKQGLPSYQSPPSVNLWRAANLPHLLRGAVRPWLANLLGLATVQGALRLAIIHPIGDARSLLREYAARGYPGGDFPSWASQRARFERIDLGLVGLRCVTNAGVGFIVDAWQNLVELEIMRYHALGTGATPEGAGEVALVTELTTEYTPDNTRATGTLTEGAPNIFQTVATNTLSGGGALLREHGLMSQAATGGGVLFDRTLFALITLADGDSLQSTYNLTLTAGG